MGAQSDQLESIERLKPVERLKPIGEGFFETPLFQAATVGIPFCIFKFLFGVLIMRTAAGHIAAGQIQGLQLILGWMVITWSLADLLMNLARVAFQLLGGESPVEYCIIAQIGRLFGRPRLFLSLDTFLSFSIICIVLWSGWIKSLDALESYLWYAATTLNLISISLVNLWTEIRRGGH